MADLNKYNALSQDELEAGKGKPEFTTIEMEYDFMLIDADNDKKITRSEMNVAYGLHHKFEEVDINRDG